MENIYKPQPLRLDKPVSNTTTRWRYRLLLSRLSRVCGYKVQTNKYDCGPSHPVIISFIDVELQIRSV